MRFADRPRACREETLINNNISMKNKLTFIITLLIVLAIGLWLGLNLAQKDNLEPAEENTTMEFGVPDSVIVMDDFTMSIPLGWEKTDAPQGSIAMVINNDEEVINARVKAMDFKTYSAVSKESLNGRIFGIYLEDYKDTLTQLYEGITFTHEEQTTINGQEAQVIEAKLTVNKVNFNVLFVLIKDNNENVWTITFNTASYNWDGYMKLFYQTAGSFRIR